MLEPLKKTRLYEGVATQIKGLIKKGELKVGDQLPSERELAERLNVSRTSIREALRAMEMVGYLKSKVGGSGGTFVKEVEIEQIAEPLTITREDNQHLLLEVLEVRMILEEWIARIAAEKRNENDLAELERSIEALQSDINGGGLGVEADTGFHESLANAVHNEILVKIMDMLRYMAVKIRQKTLVLPGTKAQTINDHKKILEAVKNKDSDQAAKMMKKHIEKTIRNVKRIPRQRR